MAMGLDSRDNEGLVNTLSSNFSKRVVQLGLCQNNGPWVFPEHGNSDFFAYQFLDGLESLRGSIEDYFTKRKVVIGPSLCVRCHEK